MTKLRKLSSLSDLSGLITHDQVTEPTPEQPEPVTEVHTPGMWAVIRSAQPPKFMPSPVTMEDLNDIANTLKENTDKRLKDQHKANLETLKHLPQFGKD